jgi:hypothetical protein
MLIWKNEGIDLGKGNAASETQNEVRRVLEKFQEGYTRREVSEIDFYMEELFSKAGDTLVVGTADSEWCMGINDIKRLIESDWKYWGDLKLDVEGAVVSSYGEVAWLTTEGVVSSTSSADKMYGKYIEKVKDTLSQEAAEKDKLIDILKSVSICLYENNLGNEVIRPIRFTAVLVKADGKWRFHNIHFSHATILPADVRIIGESRIS